MLTSAATTPAGEFLLTQRGRRKRSSDDVMDEFEPRHQYGGRSNSPTPPIFCRVVISVPSADGAAVDMLLRPTAAR